MISNYERDDDDDEIWSQFIRVRAAVSDVSSSSSLIYAP